MYHSGKYKHTSSASHCFHSKRSQHSDCPMLAVEGQNGYYHNYHIRYMYHAFHYHPSDAQEGYGLTDP